MKEKVKMKDLGIKHFGPRISVTDPCYDRDQWYCRADDLPIVSGDYCCKVWQNTETKRVHQIQIALDGVKHDSSKTEILAVIDVDAGLAGFFNRKEDYKDQEWYEFCDSLNLEDDDAWIREDGKMDGFFSSTGYGDGSYLVECERNENSEIISVLLNFIGMEHAEIIAC